MKQRKYFTQIIIIGPRVPRPGRLFAKHFFAKSCFYAIRKSFLSRRFLGIRYIVRVLQQLTTPCVITHYIIIIRMYTTCACSGTLIQCGKISSVYVTVYGKTNLIPQTLILQYRAKRACNHYLVDFEFIP